MQTFADHDREDLLVQLLVVLHDALGRGEKSGSAWRFKDPRLRGVAAALIDHLEARVRTHRAAGDLGAWLSHDLGRTRGSPDHTCVGDGTYGSSWDVFGLGLALDL